MDGRVTRCLALLSLAGCGPAVLPGDGTGAGTGASDDASSTTAASATTSPNPPATTGSTATTVVDDTSDVDDGPFSPDCGAAPPGEKHHCIGLPECEPPMDGVVAGVLVDGGAWPDAGSGPPDTLPYVFTCTIAGSAEDVDLLTLQLACVDGEHTLAIGTSVGLAFDTSGDFVLTVLYDAENPFIGGQMVTLRRADGELVLAGAQGWPPPDGTSVPDGFFDPLAVTVIADRCEIEPPGPDECAATERQALAFFYEGDIAEVYDRGVDQLGPYVLLVARAVQYHDVECTDAVEHVYSWLAAPPIPD